MDPSSRYFACRQHRPRVVLIYRQPRVGAYSIENIFRAIGRELRKEVELIEYELGPRSKLLRDIINLRGLQADIYHVTGDVNYLVPLLPCKKTVLTIHDIGHYLFGLSGIKRWLYKWMWLILPMRTAAAITTVSDATRKNILAYLPIQPDRLQTIDNCYSTLFSPVPRPFNETCPVILQVGTKPYKNVPRLVQALKGIPCKLVLIGEVDEAIESQLLACKVDYESRTNLSDEQIVQAYVDSDLVSFVSIGEGFGMPIIEAQACGRPVVTSDEPPMSDVAGVGACLASASSVESIRSAILRLIHDPVYREQVIQAGLENAKRYSAASIAERYFNLYKRIISK